MQAVLIGLLAGAICFWALTFVILKVVGALVPLRVKQDDEVIGLDVTIHGEAIQ